MCSVCVFMCTLASVHLKVSRAAVLEEVKQNAAGQFTLHNIPVRSTTGLNKHKMHTATSTYSVFMAVASCELHVLVYIGTASFTMYMDVH